MQYPFLTMDQVQLQDKRVIIREDLNVPLADGQISNDERIKRALPTIKKAIKQNARVLLLSHLGRPTEGEYEDKFSLAPVAAALSKELGQQVSLSKDWLSGIDLAPGQVVLAENVRFNPGEKNNDAQLSQKMASFCDVFVMDAFATAHRAQASTVGIAEYAAIACAGPLLVEELDALHKALADPKKPLVAIVGGAKVSSKIDVLTSLINKVDTLIVGGGIANTFLKATGIEVGKSLYEADWIENAKQLLHTAEQKGVAIPLPVDVRVAKEFSQQAQAETKSLDSIASDDLILDVGPKTAASYPQLMNQSGTIVFNGPVGVFEFPAFAQGTQALGQAVADAKAFSIAGGGDTIAALEQFGLSDQISYISTGGGAFLDYLQGVPLPAVVVLEKRNKVYARQS